jgi:hypothetical protein
LAVLKDFLNIMSVTLVSEKGYADRTGMGKTTIRDAREKGLIVKGWDGDLKQYKFEIAEAEWGVAYRVKMQAKGKVFTPVVKGAGGKAKDGQATKQGADSEEPEDLVYIPHIPPVTYVGPDQGDLFADLNDFKPGVKVDLAEALRVKEYNDARYKKMKADELAGILVKKSDVDNQLAIAAIEIRKEIERLPAKCVDGVRAANTRTEALLVMEDMVMNMLEQLGNVITTALKNKNDG